MKKIVRLILFITDPKVVHYIQVSIQMYETSSKENLNNLGELNSEYKKKVKKKRRQSLKYVNSSYKNHALLHYCNIHCR